MLISGHINQNVSVQQRLTETKTKDAQCADQVWQPFPDYKIAFCIHCSSVVDLLAVGKVILTGWVVDRHFAAVERLK